MRGRRKAGATSVVGLAGIGVMVLWALGCGEATPVADSAVQCPGAPVAEAEPDFGSIEEAKNHFEQLADEAHRAVIRYEHALRALREDRRWDEPDQRIWLSIATTETLTAIEENRRNEQKAQQQLQLLAQR